MKVIYKVLDNDENDVEFNKKAVDIAFSKLKGIKSYNYNALQGIIVFDYDEKVISKKQIKLRLIKINFDIVERTKKTDIKNLHTFIKKLYEDGYRLINSDILDIDNYDFFHDSDKQLSVVEFLNLYDRSLRLKHYKNRYEELVENDTFKRSNYLKNDIRVLEREIAELENALADELKIEHYDNFNQNQSLKKIELYNSKIESRKDLLNDLKTLLKKPIDKETV